MNIEINYHQGINSTQATIIRLDEFNKKTIIKLDDKELKFLLNSLIKNIDFEIK